MRLLAQFALSIVVGGWLTAQAQIESLLLELGESTHTKSRLAARRNIMSS